MLVERSSQVTHASEGWLKVLFQHWLGCGAGLSAHLSSPQDSVDSPVLSYMQKHKRANRNIKDFWCLDSEWTNVCPTAIEPNTQPKSELSQLLWENLRYSRKWWIVLQYRNQMETTIFLSLSKHQLEFTITLSPWLATKTLWVHMLPCLNCTVTWQPYHGKSSPPWIFLFITWR